MHMHVHMHMHMHMHMLQQVGRKPSSASAYLGDHSDVVELLKMLASLSAAKRKNASSTGDLTNLDVGGLNAIGANPPTHMDRDPAKQRGLARSSQSVGMGR